MARNTPPARDLPNPEEVKGEDLPPVRDNGNPPVEGDQKPSDELVTEGQKLDPATPEAHDKDGEAAGLAAPGEAIAGAERGRFKTTGSFLAFDPYTLDCVGEDGGEMRVTQFVRDRLADGKLVEA